MHSKMPFHLLFVTENSALADSWKDALSARGHAISITSIRGPAQLLPQLQADPPDAVVVSVEARDVASVLGALKKAPRPVPFLALHGDPGLDADLLENFIQNLPARSEDTLSFASLLSAIEENTSDGLFLVNGEGKITFVNRSAEKLCGLSRDDLEQNDISRLWAQASSTVFREALSSVLLSDTSVKQVEGFIRHRSGRNIPVVLNAAPVKDRLGKRCAVLTLKNNTELRRASADITLLHKQMDVERSHFETIMKQFPAGILIAEAPSGRIIFFNAQAQTLLGNEAVAASSIEDYGQIPAFTADGEVLQAVDWPLSRALATGTCVPGGVIRVYQKDTQSDRYLSLNAAPIFNSEGQVSSAVMAIFDITAEREAQLSMVQAKEEAERANHAKTAFLANISHEIRTPLGAVIGFTGLLRNGDIPPEEQEETLAIIERNGQDLLRLIDEILDLSKVEAQKMDIHKVEASVPTILRDVLSLLGHRAREKGLALSVNTRPDTPDIVTTDPARLKQILVNIVGNAIKFTEKGSVTVEIEPEGEAILRFRIKDSGIGISTDQRSQLFQPFSQIDSANTRRFGGTGLGLLLSRKLARLLGGDVILEDSAPGVGSTFLITIDAAPARKKVQAPAQESRTPQAQAGRLNISRDRLQSLSILAADDSHDNQQLLKTFLTRYGAKVDFASNGHEAVEKAVASPYDIVLMDLQMPVCDGYHATQRLRSLGFDKPILALSAHARNEEQEKSLIAGCNDHITKPINMNGLLAAIVRHTGLDAHNP